MPTIGQLAGKPGPSDARVRTCKALTLPPQFLNTTVGKLRHRYSRALSGPPDLLYGLPPPRGACKGPESPLGSRNDSLGKSLKNREMGSFLSKGESQETLWPVLSLSVNNRKPLKGRAWH